MLKLEIIKLVYNYQYLRSNLRRQNSRNKFTTSASTTTTTTTVAPPVAEVDESNVSEQEVPEPTTAKAIGYLFMII